MGRSNRGARRKLIGRETGCTYTGNTLPSLIFWWVALWLSFFGGLVFFPFLSRTVALVNILSLTVSVSITIGGLVRAVAGKWEVNTAKDSSHLVVVMGSGMGMGWNDRSGCNNEYLRQIADSTYITVSLGNASLMPCGELRSGGGGCLDGFHPF